MGNCTQSQTMNPNDKAELLIRQLSSASPKSPEQCSQLLRVIQQLIQSKEQRDRAAAYSLMHKLEEIFDSNRIVADAIKSTKQEWSEYITLCEQLEGEPHMHPNLLSSIDKLKSINDFVPWLRILYLRLLQSDNISVIYETVKYIVTQFKFSHLRDWNVVNEFLAATNRIQLYNIDEDDRQSLLFDDFVSISELGSFIEALVNVPWEWHSVPLYEWLESLPKEKMGHSSGIDYELMLRLGSRVHAMKNTENLYDAQVRVVEIFQTSLSTLTIGKFVKFIETTYHCRIVNWFAFIPLDLKIIECDHFETQVNYFDKKSWDIISRSRLGIDFVVAVTNKLYSLAITDHGILRFLIISKITSSLMIHNFCYTVYGVHKSLILRQRNLKNLQKYLSKKLQCKTKRDKALALEVSVDLFVTSQLKIWNDIKDLHLKPLELLEQGGIETFQHLGELLGKCRERLEDDKVLPAFVALLKKFRNSHMLHKIEEYACKHLNTKEQNKLAVDIISFHIHHNQDIVQDLLQSEIKVPLRQVLEGILHYTPLTDEWIEATYLREKEPVPIMFLKYVLRQPHSYVQDVGDELLRLNREESEFYTWYTRNSEAHRVRFHIAQSLMFLGEKYICTDELWSVLMLPNELFDITCMYEMLVAKTLRYPEELLKRLQSIATLEPNQQMSLLSVAHIYLVQKHWNTPRNEDIRKIFALMMTPMRDDYFQVQVLHRLYAMWKEKGLNELISFDISDKLKSPDILLKGQSDVRLQLPVLYSITFRESRQWENICYCFHMSNIRPWQWENNYLCVTIKINQFRKSIKTTYTETQQQEINKNPISNADDLVPQNILANNPYLIVAVLLENDLERLTDFIQTYKAFEVQTLILSDSPYLSSSSEDNFNIIKVESDRLQSYLHEKKLENYNIIDIQRTNRNVNFAEFTFAKKTILLFKP